MTSRALDPSETKWLFLKRPFLITADSLLDLAFRSDGKYYTAWYRSRLVCRPEGGGEEREIAGFQQAAASVRPGQRACVTALLVSYAQDEHHGKITTRPE